jgi:hypothetical protein
MVDIHDPFLMKRVPLLIDVDGFVTEPINQHNRVLSISINSQNFEGGLTWDDTPHFPHKRFAPRFSSADRRCDFKMALFDNSEQSLPNETPSGAITIKPSLSSIECVRNSIMHFREPAIPICIVEVELFQYEITDLPSSSLSNCFFDAKAVTVVCSAKKCDLALFSATSDPLMVHKEFLSLAELCSSWLSLSESGDYALLPRGDFAAGGTQVLEPPKPVRADDPVHL